MKRKFQCLMLCFFIMLILAVPVFSAGGGSAVLNGPAAVRAGDVINLTFSVAGSSIHGVTGTLQYDGNQLEMVSGPTQAIGAPWIVEFNGGNMVAYDNDMSSPINGQTALFTVSFRVKDLPEGTAIRVSMTNVKASDGHADDNIGTVTYSTTVAPPLSTNSFLIHMEASNATITPAFSPYVEHYTAQVPYEVAVLDIRAVASDNQATVAIYSPELTPNGITQVVVTVTAQNGSVRAYTIDVTRAQDPNYVASGDNTLAGITVDGFLLSPAFDAGKTEYVVWVPYETEFVTVTGVASDSKATVRTEGGEALEAGKANPVNVICRAENGEEKVYTVQVQRAAAHGTDAVPPETQPTEPLVPTAPSTTAPITQPSTQPTGPAEDTPREIPWMYIGLAILAGVALGFVLGLAVPRKKKTAPAVAEIQPQQTVLPVAQPQPEPVTEPEPAAPVEAPKEPAKTGSGKPMQPKQQGNCKKGKKGKKNKNSKKHKK